jgi:hypothetical protein
MRDARIPLRRVLDAARCVHAGQFVHHGMVSAQDIEDADWIGDWLLLNPDALPPLPEPR